MPTSHSLIALGRDRSLYAGDLPATDWHRHGAPVLLIDLSGPIDVEVASRSSTSSAMRPSSRPSASSSTPAPPGTSPPLRPIGAASSAGSSGPTWMPLLRSGRLELLDRP
jgi:hypothetical protein